MTVLVVDDAPDNVAIASQVVARMGHRAVTASSGEEALEKFSASRPDMVLMDVMMPGMDGLEATRRIREMATGWLPILMVTALGREDEIVQGLRAGADDYLLKPLSLPVFQSKVKVFERIAVMQRELRQHAEELSAYYCQAEEERRLGARLMEYMIGREGLKDPALRYRITPAWHFSGDLLAAARTPGQNHHILLSDGMGHGLPAAIGSLPLFDTFYSMTGLGYGIARIAEVMNSRLYAMSTEGRFAAVTLVSVNPVAGTIEVWNGGNPYPCLVDSEGKVVKRWKSRHVPMGILPPESFSTELEVFSYDGDCQLFLWSDGLTEAENADGLQFGAEHAWAVLESADRENRFDTLLQALDQHRADSLIDDIAVAMLEVPAPGTVMPPAIPAGGAEAVDDCLRMSFHFEALELRYLEIAPLLIGVIEKIALTKEHAGQIFIILTELVSNALDHGLLRIDSSLKTVADGFDTYDAHRRNALAALQEGYIEIDIAILRHDERDMVKISLRDSGPGFDWEHGAQDTDNALSGRGIDLVRRLSYSVQYLGAGNEVEVYYCLG